MALTAAEETAALSVRDAESPAQPGDGPFVQMVATDFGGTIVGCDVWEYHDTFGYNRFVEVADSSSNVWRHTEFDGGLYEKGWVEI